MKPRALTWVIGVSLSAALSLTLIASPPAQAQTYTVLHNFTGAADGATPYAGVSLEGILPLLAMRNTDHGSGPRPMAVGCGAELCLAESVSPIACPLRKTTKERAL